MNHLSIAIQASYLNSLSMLFEDVDSDNGFIKLRIQGLDDFIV